MDAPWILYKCMVRLLQSDRNDFLAVFRWELLQVWNFLPPPPDGVLFVTVDKTTVEKTGKKGPANGKTKDSELGPWKYGFQVVVLMANWGPYRFPVDFRVVRRKTDPEYSTPNALFLEMLEDFRLPHWARRVVVLGDAGFASKGNMQAIVRMGFFYVFSLARTWKFSAEHRYSEKYGDVKSFVNHAGWFRCGKVWFRNADGSRRSYWVYSERVALNVVGDVTMVISKKTANSKPEKAKILVTNIPGIEARDVVRLYARRWYVECLFRELKGACGLGHQQVTKKVERVERAAAMSMCSYLLILRFEHERIPYERHWSLLTLKHWFTLRLLQAQCDERKSAGARNVAG